MKTARTHRLDGLEPDNLLAFLALLGLLRALETSRPAWRPRVSWTVGEPPVRPALHLREMPSREDICIAAAEGIGQLAADHRFPRRKLALVPEQARRQLSSAAEAGGYRAALWSALVSDKAQQQGKSWVEPTPFCLGFGQGGQYFLENLALLPRTLAPAPEGRGRNRRAISETECLREALFLPWRHPDRRDRSVKSCRWDPVDDVRYAYRAINPKTAMAKQRTQHGANRLASVGLSCLTVAPRRQRFETRLAVRGGARPRGGFTLTWPIWRDPVSRVGIEALLCHPYLDLPEVAARLGVVELRQTRRISSGGKNMNFTRAASVPFHTGSAPKSRTTGGPSDKSAQSS